MTKRRRQACGGGGRHVEAHISFDDQSWQRQRRRRRWQPPWRRWHFWWRPCTEEQHDGSKNHGSDKRVHDSRHGHGHSHSWAGYKGPMLESKQANPNSEFYTKYVHSTIEKKGRPHRLDM